MLMRDPEAIAKAVRLLSGTSSTLGGLMSRLACVAFAAIFVITPMRAFSQVLDTATHRLRVNVSERTVSDGTLVLTLPVGDVQTATIRNERAIQFVIVDYNPILFSYAVTLSTPTDTPDYTAAKSMLDQLTSVVNLLGGAK